MAQYSRPTDEEIVTTHAPLVWKYINKFYPLVNASPRLEMDDVFQSCMVRVLSSVDNYDPERGDWVNFMAWQIRGAIAEVLRKDKMGRANDRTPAFITVPIDPPTEDDYKPSEFDSVSAVYMDQTVVELETVLPVLLTELEQRALQLVLEGYNGGQVGRILHPEYFPHARLGDDRMKRWGRELIEDIRTKLAPYLLVDQDGVPL